MSRSEELSGVFGGFPCPASSSAMRTSSALFCATNSLTRAVSPLICRSSSSTSGFTSSASESTFSGDICGLAVDAIHHAIHEIADLSTYCCCQDGILFRKSTGR
jgi:hypothetical protein